MSATSEKLLKVENLVLHFKTTMGPVQAVDGVDFELDANRAVVILGESGCGKTSLAKAILRLLPRNVSEYSGKIMLEGKDVMVGVIDVASPEIETPEQIADTIGEALKYVPMKHLIACTNCGLAPMSREVATAKLEALAAGAKLARERYAAA